MALNSPTFNVYEREREERLARNRQEFVRLGLSSARRLTFPVAGITVDIPKPKQKRADPVRPQRVSARTCGKYQPNYSEASPDKRLRVKLLRLERSRMSTSVESAMPAEQQELTSVERIAALIRLACKARPTRLLTGSKLC